MRLQVIEQDGRHVLTACEEMLSQAGFINGEVSSRTMRSVRTEIHSDSSLLVDLKLEQAGHEIILDIHASRFFHRTALLGCDSESEERLAADFRSLLQIA